MSFFRRHRGDQRFGVSTNRSIRARQAVVFFLCYRAWIVVKRLLTNTAHCCIRYAHGTIRCCRGAEFGTFQTFCRSGVSRSITVCIDRAWNAKRLAFCILVLSRTTGFAPQGSCLISDVCFPKVALEACTALPYPSLVAHACCGGCSTRAVCRGERGTVGARR